MQTTIRFIPAADHAEPLAGSGAIGIDNTVDPRELPLDGVSRIDLHFPKFTDGRAYSQAFLLRRRLGFKGEIRATGDVLVDQLVQLERSGFDSAVLRHATDAAVIERQDTRFAEFYQGDVVTPLPLFARANAIARSKPVARPRQTGIAAERAAGALPRRIALAGCNTQGTPTNAVTHNAKASDGFMAKLTQTRQALIALAAQHAGPAGGAAPTVVQASSLGAEDMVISHLINALELDVGIFVLQTGVLHGETLALLDQLKATSRAPVTVYEPRQEAVLQFVAREGKDAMYKSIALRKACCGIRKMEPLGRALAGKTAWISGLRREQSGARAEVPLRDDSDPVRTKLNPLADWTWGDVWHYIAAHEVDYNPLHDQFYPSIGCAPCTRAISPGEDFRAGRWWWEDESAKECGLHVTRTNQQQEESHA